VRQCARAVRDSPNRAMAQFNFEVFRFRSAAATIARALGVEPPPECRIQNGRTYLTFRRLGAARWDEAQQMELVRRAVAVTRAVLADDDRRQLRKSAPKAIVVAFEDASLVDGCPVTARWECTVPGQA
jgi:hypothetical protein